MVILNTGSVKLTTVLFTTAMTNDSSNFFHHNFGVTATVRKLTEKRHKVTVIALDACQELVQKLMPNISDYSEMIISTDISSPAGNPFAVFAIMDEAFRLNFTIRLFTQLDDFITKSQTGICFVFYVWEDFDITVYPGWRQLRKLY